MTDERLRQAAELLRAGRQKKARRLLIELVEENELHEQAWLLLSAATDSLEDQLTALRNTLYINPHNQKAKQRLIFRLTKQGKAALQKGNTAEASAIFKEALTHDPQAEAGWLWLSQAAETVEDQIAALEQAQRLNPHNKHTAATLTTLHKLTADPFKLADHYINRGDIGRATEIYQGIAWQSNNGQQALAKQKLQQLEEERALNQEPVVPPRPTSTLLRLMFGPPLFYALVVLLHEGLNPLNIDPILITASLLVFLGSFLMVGTRMTPDHVLWLQLFGAHGLQRPLRIGIWLTGLCCVLVPFILVFTAAWQRYQATITYLPWHY